MRKLATIRIVSDLLPIPGADAIELAIVGGWQCVVKKGEVEIGERVIYFEIDSVLPVRPEFEFLRKSCYVSNHWITGFRLKTMRFRGQTSQGLALPLHVFSELSKQDLPIQSDVTALLGVQKWDPPLPAQLNGEAKGSFPSFIPKTDQERIQNGYEAFKKRYADHAFEVTLKLDGASCTLYQHNQTIGVCSRNLELDPVKSDPNNTYIRVYHQFEHSLLQLNQNLAFQGELMGPGIQGNRENLREHVFYVFDVYNIDQKRYLTAEERKSVLLDGMQHVPVIETEMKWFIKLDSLQAMLDFSNRPSVHHAIAEGVVCKSIMDPSVSFKVINNEFLLKEK